MGSGANYTRNQARKETLKALQNYYVKHKKYNVCACNIGKLNAARNKATLPDGTVVDVQPIGLPSGSFCMTCPLHSSKRTTISPEPNTIHMDGGNHKGYIIEKDNIIDSLITGLPLLDTRSGFTISQLKSSPFYIRQIGRSSESDSKKYRIPIQYLDPKVDPGNIQIKLSADGKCLLIGGFYQNHPPERLYEDQISQGSGGCGGNCQALEGYDYHTYASWTIFAGIDLDLNNLSETDIPFKSAHAGKKDLTNECYNKITAPQTKGLGSASVFRLFPTISDIQGVGSGSGEALGQGIRVDTSGKPVDARFFPAEFDSYAWTGLHFDLRPGDPSWYLENYEYIQQGLFGGASLQTQWENDAKNHALFLNNGKSSIAIKDSNLVYSFNVDDTGTIYTVDIVGDISYATVYWVVSSDLNVYGTSRYRTVYTSNSDVDCSYSQHTYSEFDYTYQADYYPWLSVFYNSFFDINIMDGTTTTPKLYQPYGPRIHEFKSFGSMSNDDPDNGFFQSGSATSSYTSCGLIQFNFDNPQLQELAWWTHRQEPPLTTPPCMACDFQGRARGYYFLCCVSDDVHSVSNWDGSSIVLLNDPNTPLYGIDCFQAPALITVSGQCGGLFYPDHLSCCSQFYWGHAVDNTYRDIGQNTQGWINSYRYGRGISSFDSIMKVTSTSEGETYTASTSSYIGPAIQIARLSSHSNQNHVLNAFRSTTGGKACIYQCADPFTIDDVQSGVIDLTQYMDDFAAGLAGEENDFYDSLFNGENVLEESGRFASANQDSRPSNIVFSRYFWSTPYVSIGTNMAVSTNESLSALPPDVFTDRILAPFGTFPLFIEDGKVFGLATLPPSQWNLLDPTFTDPQHALQHTTLNLNFPCNQLRPVDSFIINGYLKRNIQVLNSDGSLKIVPTTFLTRYNITETGSTAIAGTVQDHSILTNESVMDYLIPISI